VLHLAVAADNCALRLSEGRGGRWTRWSGRHDRIGQHGEHAGVVVCVSAGVPLRLESELLAASVAVLGGDGRWGSSVAAFAARGARKVS
jgi:hypothetical protein